MWLRGCARMLGGGGRPPLHRGACVACVRREVRTSHVSGFERCRAGGLSNCHVVAVTIIKADGFSGG